ncbi:hypothetical protein N656DRAFT_774128 [Canariomyces notabilis]|uniref:Uncharacterized protein n=1 Tax=Canariomyces notabilis TaxID=2074819 RepID=A0AAN6YXM7_9PEZI|nr:hypothetical protein N656DRAFT_774128 [Canariomyces arenarius]
MPQIIFIVLCISSLVSLVIFVPGYDHGSQIPAYVLDVVHDPQTVKQITTVQFMTIHHGI